MLYFHTWTWACFVYLLSLVLKINHLSGLHFPLLPPASLALNTTGHFAFGYVLLLPSPLLNLVLSNGLKNLCIYARTITDLEEHKAAIKYSGEQRLWEVAKAPVNTSKGEGPGLDFSFTGPRQAVVLLLRQNQIALQITQEPWITVLPHSSRKTGKVHKV